MIGRYHPWCPYHYVIGRYHSRAISSSVLLSFLLASRANAGARKVLARRCATQLVSLPRERTRNEKLVASIALAALPSLQKFCPARPRASFLARGVCLAELLRLALGPIAEWRTASARRDSAWFNQPW